MKWKEKFGASGRLASPWTADKNKVREKLCGDPSVKCAKYKAMYAPYTALWKAMSAVGEELGKIDCESFCAATSDDPLPYRGPVSYTEYTEDW